MKVDELEINQFDALVLDLTEDVLGGFGHDVNAWRLRGSPPGTGLAGPYGAA
jgi:hypothetical protein